MRVSDLSVVGLVVTALLGGLLVGGVVGSCGRPHELIEAEMPQEMRTELADVLYAKYARGQVLHRRQIQVFGTAIDVDIVDTIRAGECGFVASDALRSYLVVPGEFKLFQYNGEYAFVVLDAQHYRDVTPLPADRADDATDRPGEGTGS